MRHYISLCIVIGMFMLNYIIIIIPILERCGMITIIYAHKYTSRMAALVHIDTSALFTTVEERPSKCERNVFSVQYSIEHGGVEVEVRGLGINYLRTRSLSGHTYHLFHYCHRGRFSQAPLVDSGTRADSGIMFKPHQSWGGKGTRSPHECAVRAACAASHLDSIRHVVVYTFELLLSHRLYRIMIHRYYYVWYNIG